MKLCQVRNDFRVIYIRLQVRRAAAAARESRLRELMGMEPPRLLYAEHLILACTVLVKHQQQGQSPRNAYIHDVPSAIS